MGGDIDQLGEQLSRAQKEKKYIEDLYNVSKGVRESDI